MYFFNRLTGGPRHGPPDPPTRGAPPSAVRLDLPDLPRPRIRRVERVPVPVERFPLRQHARADGVDERIPVDRDEIVLVEDNPLDLLDQPFALREIQARLVLLPQRFDLGIADERGRAIAHGVHGDVGLRAAGARIDVLHDRAIPGESLAPLPDLRSEGRALQRLHLAANSDRPKVGDDALGHVEVWRERRVVDLEPGGDPGLRHQLLRLLEVELRHGSVLPLQRVAILRADPVAPRLADALRFLLHEELAVDRQADRLTHALVAERAALLVAAGEHEPPRPREVRVPPEALVRHQAGEQLSRHAEREVELTGLQPGHARREVPDALDDDRLGRRRPAPVLLERLERHLHAGLLTHELVRAGTDRLGLEPVSADLLVVVLGHDPADAADAAVVEVHEVDERLLEVEYDRAVVHDLDVLELVVKEIGRAHV